MASDSRKAAGKPNPIVTVCGKKGRDQTKKYKSVHSIGSRKLREKFVSYNDTYPMYESVLQVYLDSKKEAMTTKEQKAKKRKHEEMKEPNNNVIVKPDKKTASLPTDKTEKKPKLEKKSKSCSDAKTKKSDSDSKEKSAKKDKQDVANKTVKEKGKKTIKNEFNAYQFIRLKREASLNASARVNIMFEKLPSPPKKTKPKQNDISKKDKAVKDKVKIKTKKLSVEKASKDKAVVKKDNSCKDKVEAVKKQRDEIIKCRKHKIEEKKNKAKLNKGDKPKSKGTDSKESCVKQIKKLLTKCKKDKTKDNNSNVKKKREKKKDLIKKKVKDKMSLLGKTGKRMASLNAKALMAASKEVRTSMERAARIDRFCVSWNRVTMPPKHLQPSARWVEGLGSTLCCTSEASVCISKKEQQICEESKATAATTVIAAIQKPAPPCPIPETELITDDRPSSVVDVVGAHTPIKPLSRTPHCLSPMFASGHNCVPPCNGYSCGSGSERFVTGQYQSLTLGGIGSLSSIQMMSYNPQYRSAFSVPFNHTGLPPYGYYGGGFYQASPPAVIHQPALEACLLPHHLPVHVPHAQVKVLIHNPDSTHDCAFTNFTKQDQELLEDASAVGKKGKSDGKAKTESAKPKKKVERRRSKSPKEDVLEKLVEKLVPEVQKPVPSPPHNWSWSGEPEMKMVPTLGEGPSLERKCYPAIKHSDGDMIHVRDCVLLRSGPRKKDIPFVAKVSALWEHPDNADEMMMSLLWYYRPEHTEIGRKTHHVDCEVFASKHRDENSVACIDDKGYVLTFNEYCRYRAEVSRNEQVSCAKSKVVPDMDSESPITHRMPGINVDPSTVFVCRQVYDFRQKRMLKNPS